MNKVKLIVILLHKSYAEMVERVTDLTEKQNDKTNLYFQFVIPESKARS